MEEYVIYLLYLALVLILGLVITVFSNKLKLSNILFLVLAGHVLNLFSLNFFNDEIILVLSSLALILIVLETTFNLDLAHIIRKFFNVLKFSLVFFVIVSYTLTLLVYQLFDFPGKDFEVFVMCFLLSVIMYGVDPYISMEFFQSRKRKVKDMMMIEGIISGPIVVIFSFFVINYLINSSSSFSMGVISNSLIFGKQIIFALVIGLSLSYLLFYLFKYVFTTSEISTLFIISISIVAFVLGEFLGSNGSLAVALFGLLFRELSIEHPSKHYTTIFAHTLYIIVFILFGIEFTFPSLIIWFKGLGLFLSFLLLRFLCVQLFMHKLKFKERLYMTLNVAKGIEVAIVLFIMKINFSSLEGINLILDLGFMAFVLSYLLSTVVSYFEHYFLGHEKHDKA